jgi:ubiquinone/menaquinone biosynthesis C-methylase UbiE
MVYNRAVNEEKSDQVIQAWRESAPYWEKNSEIIHQMLAPITTSMMEEAGISSGQSVLDVACGAGEPSLTIARAVDPGGHVVCTDVAPEMVCIAARAAARRGLTNVDFGQCAAESLPFPIASFDRVICRLGVMFLANPLDGVHEMLRVLRSRGTLTLAVWSAPDFNPFFRVVTQVMSRHLASPPEDPSAPGAFRFAGQGEIAGLLAQAGAQRVRERTLDFHMAAAVRPEDFWTLRSEMSDTLRKKIAMLTSNQLARVREEILEATQGYFSEGVIRFPAQVFVATGDRS